MKRIFFTGASGFIGSHLANALAAGGDKIHALVRKSSVTSALNHPNIDLFDGDLLDIASLKRAMQGCDHVIHLAAMAKMWSPDHKLYYDINVTGTSNVLTVAEDLKVAKIIYTSTAGVLPPVNAASRRWVDEDSQRRPELYTNYERTKSWGEAIARQCSDRGLPIVIVYPTNVFGPGPIDDCNASTRMIRDYMSGKWKIIPGDGNGMMNYVFIDDIISGFMAALEKASPGSSYILGGENASYNQFFDTIKKVTGIHGHLYRVPYPFIQGLAKLEDFKTDLLKRRPLITTEWVRKIPYNWSKNIEKAKTELDYRPTTLHEGIEKTVLWLTQTNQV